MATIGVDCSGKVDSLPMYMVAVKGGDARIVLVRRIPGHIKRWNPEWKFLAHACYAFKAVRPLFRRNPLDTVLIDRDFDYAGINKTRAYLERLLQAYFSLPGRSLVEVGDDYDRPVYAADMLSRLARKGKTKISLHDPSIEGELELLSKY